MERRGPEEKNSRKSGGAGLSRPSLNQNFSNALVELLEAPVRARFWEKPSKAPEIGENACREKEKEQEKVLIGWAFSGVWLYFRAGETNRHPDFTWIRCGLNSGDLCVQANFSG